MKKIFYSIMFSTLLFSCKKNVNEIAVLSINQNNQSLKEVNLKVASTILKITKEESEFKKQVFEECHKQKFGDYYVKIVDLLSNTIVSNLLKSEDRLILNELQTKSKVLSGNDLIIFVPSIERFYNRKISTGLRSSNQEETIGVITDEFNNPTQTAPGYIVDNNGSLTFYQTIDESFAWENDVWVFGQEENCSPENMVANPDDTDVLTYGRTNGQTENGGVIKVTDWSLVEPWVLGKPEFRQVVYKGSATPTNAIFDKKYGKWRRQNFNGQFTPRLSAVYTFSKKHNLRASFQTGFRNPDTQAQFIYFPSSSGTLLGSTEANAARYGVHNGGAYTDASYSAFRSSGGTLAADGTPTGGNSSVLVTADIPYVQPEKLKSVELGYKGVFNQVLMIDINGYYTSYQDFIGGQIVAVKKATSHQGKTVPAGSLYSVYNNSLESVTSLGAGIGFTYSLPRNFTLSGNYSYASFSANEDADFRAGFNTPKNKFSIGLGNRKIVNNLGFNVNFRYQEGYLWQSSYGVWNVPAFGVLDAQINYKLMPLKSMIKIGATNLGGGDYRTNLGAPFVGQMYYVSITFDEFLR